MVLKVSENTFSCAVSYTHLDVYQSQEQYPTIIGNDSKIDYIGVLDYLRDNTDVPYSKPDAPGPVSYTHLDVYKRQLQVHHQMYMVMTIAEAIQADQQVVHHITAARVLMIHMRCV